MKIKIERGIKRPLRDQQARWLPLISKMRVNDSVVLTNLEAVRLRAAGKKHNIRFLWSRIDDHTKRVWHCGKMWKSYAK